MSAVSSRMPPRISRSWCFSVQLGSTGLRLRAALGGTLRGHPLLDLAGPHPAATDYGRRGFRCS
jgi:hypothetical protein